LIEEEDIEQIFLDAKERVISLLDMFRFYEISKDYKSLSIGKN